MTITIWPEGKKVIARNNQDGLSAHADCSPEDMFDFEIGAKLALSRLLEAMKNKPIQVGEYVRIINNGDLFTTNVSWILDHVKKPEWVAKFAYGDDLGYPQKADATIKYRVRVIDNEHNMALIQRNPDGICYLIQLTGIERWIKE